MRALRSRPRVDVAALAVAVGLGPALGAPRLCLADGIERSLASIDVRRSGAAATCPDGAALAAAVTRAAGRGEIEPAEDPAARVRFRVDFGRDDVAFTATVHVEGELHGDRTVTSPERTCETLGQAAVVTITIMLDGVTTTPASPPAEPRAASSAPREPLPDDAPWDVPPGGAERQAAADTYRPRASLFPAPAESQPDLETRTAMNDVFVEAFGSGVAYSVNYERFLTDDTSVRVGLGMVWGPDPNLTITETQLSVPLLVNVYPVGNANHKLHFGAGMTIFRRSGPMAVTWQTPDFGVMHTDGGTGVFGDAVIGYRYVPHGGGVSFGASFTPFFTTSMMWAWASTDIGVTF